MPKDSGGNESEVSEEEAYLQMRESLSESLDNLACTLSIDEDGNHVYEVASG